jgi:hypothetical protein
MCIVRVCGRTEVDLPVLGANHVFWVDELCVLIRHGESENSESRKEVWWACVGHATLSKICFT